VSVSAAGTCVAAGDFTLGALGVLAVTGAGWSSGVALLADASWVPVQASADAAATAVIARVIFWKVMLLLYGLREGAGSNLMKQAPNILPKTLRLTGWYY